MSKSIIVLWYNSLIILSTSSHLSSYSLNMFSLSIADCIRQKTKLKEILDELCFQTSKDAELSEKQMDELLCAIEHMYKTNKNLEIIISINMELAKKSSKTQTVDTSELSQIHLNIVNGQIQYVSELYPGIVSKSIKNVITSCSVPLD